MLWLENGGRSLGSRYSYPADGGNHWNLEGEAAAFGMDTLLAASKKPNIPLPEKDFDRGFWLDLGLGVERGRGDCDCRLADADAFRQLHYRSGAYRAGSGGEGTKIISGRDGEARR